MFQVVQQQCNNSAEMMQYNEPAANQQPQMMDLLGEQELGDDVSDKCDAIFSISTNINTHFLHVSADITLLLDGRRVPQRQQQRRRHTRSAVPIDDQFAGGLVHRRNDKQTT